MDFEDGEISDNSNDMFIAQDEKYKNDEKLIYVWLGNKM